MTVEEMVREFQEAAGAATVFKSKTLRHDLLMEEVRELEEAVAANDVVEIADALADITYVIVGTAIDYGIPFDRVFEEVHRSNMTKLIPPIKIRWDGKIIKGPHFEPPLIAEVLSEY